MSNVVLPELLRSFFEDTDQNDRDCNVENYSGQHGKYSYVMRRRRKMRRMRRMTILKKIKIVMMRPTLGSMRNTPTMMMMMRMILLRCNSNCPYKHEHERLTN